MKKIFTITAILAAFTLLGCDGATDTLTFPSEENYVEVDTLYVADTTYLPSRLDSCIRYEIMVCNIKYDESENDCIDFKRGNPMYLKDGKLSNFNCREVCYHYIVGKCEEYI